MDLSIIIVSFNTKDLLKKCLQSLSNLKRKAEILVVDNGSTDGSVQMIEKEFPNVQLTKNAQNMGFAKANNLGTRKAKGKYVVLLNSDTVVKENALGEMASFADQKTDLGVVGARLLNPDNSIQSSIYHFPSLGKVFNEFRSNYFEKYYIPGNQPSVVEAVVFAAVLIPKNIIEKVGLLDERYFMFFEDLDYCRRIKKSGLKVYYLPDAEIVHYHGASGKGSPATFDYSRKSSEIYYGKVNYWLLAITLRIIHKIQKITGRR